MQLSILRILIKQIFRSLTKRKASLFFHDLFLIKLINIECLCILLEFRIPHLHEILSIKYLKLRPWLEEKGVAAERSPSFEKKLGPELIVKI